MDRIPPLVGQRRRFPAAFTKHAITRFYRRFPGHSLADAFNRSIPLTHRQIEKILWHAGRKEYPERVRVDLTSRCVFIGVVSDDCDFVVITVLRMRN